MKRNKLLIATLAAAMALPVSALADTSNVTVYGKIDMSYDVTKNGVIGANRVSSNVSKIGLKGAEDLGDGLSAIWQIEQQIDIDNSGTNADGKAAKNSFATRNSFGGLKSDSMGTLLLGRHDSPYKLATRKLDVFSDTIADNRSLMGKQGAFDARNVDTVMYMSPKMGGFTALAAYMAVAENATVAGTQKGSHWSLAGKYDGEGIKAGIGYDTSTPTVAAGIVAVKSTAWKIGGGYTMDAFNVNAVYESTKTDAVAAPLKQNNVYLSGKYSFGNDAVKLAYTMAGKIDSVAGTDAKQLSLGYDHNLSKRTKVYAIYTQVSNGTAASFGLKNSGSTGPVTASGVGVKPSAWSFGVQHSF